MGPIPVQPRAALSLDFLIVGAGIGGLSCAYSLLLSGHRVTILEAYPQNGRKSYTGLRVPPNMSKILNEWGLTDEVRANTRPCRLAAFDDLLTNENIGSICWRDEIIEETGGDFLFIYYGDLYDMLLRIALEAGVKIRWGTRVSEVIPGEELPEVDPHRPHVNGNGILHTQCPPSRSHSDPATSASVTRHGPPSVQLENGEILSADIIIGADGSRSIVREVLLESDQDHGVESGYNCYATYADLGTMSKDPLLKQLVDDMDWHIWMGDKKSMLAYPVGREGKYAIHCYSHDDNHPEDNSPLPCDDPSWGIEWPKDKLIDLYSECNDVSKRLLEVVEAPIALSRHLALPSCETWVHHSHTLALLGDSAHPNLPCANQSIGMVMEDAVVFGGLFSRLRSWDQVPSLMEAYQDIRQDRTHFVAGQDQANADLCWWPPGPQRDARDSLLRVDKNRGLDEFGEGMLRDQWDSVSEVFAYSASDAAANWWVSWGMLGERAKKRATGEFLEIRKTVVPQVIAV